MSYVALQVARQNPAASDPKSARQEVPPAPLGGIGTGAGSACVWLNQMIQETSAPVVCAASVMGTAAAMGTMSVWIMALQLWKDLNIGSRMDEILSLP
ncbi:MAG: hypothetical protein LBB26_04465 [Puniceicoccales bacterium]|nr:hypothetical protein [Puniceicoccales bacterium]